MKSIRSLAARTSLSIALACALVISGLGLVLSAAPASRTSQWADALAARTLVPLAQLKTITDIRRLLGGSPFAQSASSAITSSGTVQTNAPAYVPGSPVA